MAKRERSINWEKEEKDIKSDDCETSMMTPVSQVVPIMTNFVTGDNGEMPFNAQTLQASSCLPNVIVIEESVPSGSDQQTPTASRLESRQTPKLSAKKKLLTKTFNFGESSYEDMHNYRKRDDERLQKEHELRMKNMAEIHNQVMINLKLQKEILEKFLNTI
ncbi:unnamed protein product [Diatraea saccharalis]|uniref:Uncharacterized protein n=1 Tax=Diatraea saccharalis TaxID=40085 RepID=A0A9N9WFE6_9NEOP|nr:unnamed protein product [Diatraea saccharalis]